MTRTRSRARGILFGRLSQERDLHNQSQNFSQQSNSSQISLPSQFSIGSLLPSPQSPCESCSQYSIAFEDGDNAGTSSYPYPENDMCHRHRPRDNDPYSEPVSSYRRRKPRK